MSLSLMTVYPGMVNSPQTILSSGITASDTSITVNDAAKLPSTTPFLACIGPASGLDITTETVLVTAVNSNTLTVTRAFQGTAAIWATGSIVCRMFTEYDYRALYSNINTLNTGKLDATAQAVDSDKLDNMQPTSANTVSTIVQRDSSGNFSAGTITANITGNLTGNMVMQDNRAVATTPDSYSQSLATNFKSTTAVGLSGAGSYVAVLGIAPWNDDSGGANHELAFAGSAGILYHRYGTRAGGWGSWYKIWAEDNDGTGSGLDADLIDGAHAGTSANNVLKLDSSGKVPNANLYTGSGNGIDADKLDNQEGSYYLDLGNASGTLSNNRVSTSLGAYTIDSRIPDHASSHYTDLGPVTTGALAATALFNAYTFDGIAQKIPSALEMTYDNSTWNPLTATDYKQVFAGMNAGGNITIKNNGTGGDPSGKWLGLRITWYAPDWNKYYFFKYVYMYTQTTGHSMQVKVQRSFDGTSWTDVGTYSGINTWPGHTFISHTYIPWHYNASEGTHYKYVRLLFTPTWNGTYPNNNIYLYLIKWICTYPEGEVTANPFQWDFDRNITFYNTISTPGQLKSTVATGTAPLNVASTTTVTNLSADTVDGYHAGTAASNVLLLDGSGKVPNANLYTGTGNSLDADTVDGAHAGTSANNVLKLDASGKVPLANIYTGSGNGLDADKLDNMQPATASTVSTIAQRDASGYLTAKQLISDIANGTAPIVVTSGTKVGTLNVDQVDGIHANSTATANNLFPLEADGKFPNSVLHTGTGNSLDADTVDGAHAGTSANNVLKLDAGGKVPVANLPTGTGNSLDADTVDGAHAGTSANNVLKLDSGGKVPNGNLNTGTGNGIDADSVDGAHAGTSANNVLKLDSGGKVPNGNLNTGGGNGIDADSVDTIHATGLAKRGGNTGSGLAVGWYRIAHNGAVTNGGTGADRAFALFTVRDTQSSYHSTTTFYAGYHYGAGPTLTLLSRSWYQSNGAITKVRLLTHNTYEGAAVEVYVSATANTNYTVYDNENSSGWTLDNWTAGSVPTGWTVTQLDLDTTDPVIATAAGNSNAFSVGRTGTVNTAGQFVSTLAAGTAPLVVASDTVVANLNASKLEGHPAADFMLAGAGYLPLTGGTMQGAINMGNYNLNSVNHLTIADYGYGEGIEWLGGNKWMICESPDDKSNNVGDFQFFQNGTRKMSLRTTGALETIAGITAGTTVTVGTSLNIMDTGGKKTTFTAGVQADDASYTLPLGTPGSKTFLMCHGDASGTLEWSNMSNTKGLAYEDVPVSYWVSALSSLIYNPSQVPGEEYKYATITVENGPVRCRVDGQDPGTLDGGHLLYDGDMVLLDSADDIKNFKVIAVDGFDNPGYLRVTYYEIT